MIDTRLMTSVPGSIRFKSTPTSRHSDRTLDATPSPVPLLCSALLRGSPQKAADRDDAPRPRTAAINASASHCAGAAHRELRHNTKAAVPLITHMSSDSDGDEVDAFSAVLR